jgi:hypothetical protein
MCKTVIDAGISMFIIITVTQSSIREQMNRNRKKTSKNWITVPRYCVTVHRYCVNVACTCKHIVVSILPRSWHLYPTCQSLIGSYQIWAYSTWHVSNYWHVQYSHRSTWNHMSRVKPWLVSTILWRLRGMTYCMWVHVSDRRWSICHVL